MYEEKETRCKEDDDDVVVEVVAGGGGGGFGDLVWRTGQQFSESQR